MWHQQILIYIENKHPNLELAVFGDFNLRRVTWSKDTPSTVNRLLSASSSEFDVATYVSDLLSYFNFSQNFPLHPDKGYTLDLFFSNLKDVIINSTVCDDPILPTDIRHHLYLESNLKFLPIILFLPVK